MRAFRAEDDATLSAPIRGPGEENRVSSLLLVHPIIKEASTIKRIRCAIVDPFREYTILAKKYRKIN
jgi:hypothetical protein